MNAYAKALSATALKASVSTAAFLVLFFSAVGAVCVRGAHDDALTLFAVIIAWVAPVIACGSLGVAVGNLLKLKRV